MVRSPRRSWRVRWRWLIRLSGLSSLVTVVAVVAAATCRPSWYAPAAIDVAQLKTDQKAVVDLWDAIGAALNAGRPIDFELRADQLNRWLAARQELWPELEVEIELEGARDPQLQLLDGNRLRIGATAATGAADLVVSATLHLELSGDELRLQVESVRAGVLPIPRDRVLDPVRALLSTEDTARAALVGHTITLRNRWVWRNGERRFRVRELAVSNGLARVSFEPIPNVP